MQARNPAVTSGASKKERTASGVTANGTFGSRYRQNLSMLRLHSHPNQEDPAVLAHQLMKRGRAHDALTVTDVALRGDPKDADLLLTHGLAWLAVDELEWAQWVFTQAAKQAPQWKEPWRWLGEVLVRRGRFERANDVTQRALVLDPSDAGLLALQQQLRNVLGLDLRLKEFHSHVTSEDPAMLAIELLGLDRAEDASDVTRVALQSEPEDLDLLVLHARACLKRADLTGADLALTKATDLEPEWGDPWRWLAEVWLRRDRPEHALTCVCRAVAFGCETAGISLLRARIDAACAIKHVPKSVGAADLGESDPVRRMFHSQPTWTGARGVSLVESIPGDFEISEAGMSSVYLSSINLSSVSEVELDIEVELDPNRAAEWSRITQNGGRPPADLVDEQLDRTLVGIPAVIPTGLGQHRSPEKGLLLGPQGMGTLVGLPRVVLSNSSEPSATMSSVILGKEVLGETTVVDVRAASQLTDGDALDNFVALMGGEMTAAGASADPAPVPTDSSAAVSSLAVSHRESWVRGQDSESKLLRGATEETYAPEAAPAQKTSVRDFPRLAMARAMRAKRRTLKRRR